MNLYALHFVDIDLDRVAADEAELRHDPLGGDSQLRGFLENERDHPEDKSDAEYGQKRSAEQNQRGEVPQLDGLL